MAVLLCVHAMPLQPVKVLQAPYDIPVVLHNFLTQACAFHASAANLSRSVYIIIFSMPLKGSSSWCADDIPQVPFILATPPPPPRSPSLCWGEAYDGVSACVTGCVSCDRLSVM